MSIFYVTPSDDAELNFEKWEVECEKHNLVYQDFPSGVETFPTHIPVPIGTTCVQFEALETNCYRWCDLRSICDTDSRETIDELMLGHDGVLFGSYDDIYYVCKNLPNLKHISYCQYYNFYEKDLKRAVANLKLETGRKIKLHKIN
jgi:hypothetical protein